MTAKCNGRPVGWPGTGVPPDFGGQHVSALTVGDAVMLGKAFAWIDREVDDPRRRRSCRLVLVGLMARMEDDTLPDGRRFASASARSVAEDLGMDKMTVARTLRTLTSGPVELIWKPSGQRIGACYALRAVP